MNSDGAVWYCTFTTFVFVHTDCIYSVVYYSTGVQCNWCPVIVNWSYAITFVFNVLSTYIYVTYARSFKTSHKYHLLTLSVRTGPHNEDRGFGCPDVLFLNTSTCTALSHTSEWCAKIRNVSRDEWYSNSICMSGCVDVLRLLSLVRTTNLTTL